MKKILLTFLTLFCFLNAVHADRDCWRLDLKAQQFEKDAEKQTVQVETLGGATIAENKMTFVPSDAPQSVSFTLPQSTVWQTLEENEDVPLLMVFLSSKTTLKCDMWVGYTGKDGAEKYGFLLGDREQITTSSRAVFDVDEEFFGHVRFALPDMDKTQPVRFYVGCDQSAAQGTATFDQNLCFTSLTLDTHHYTVRRHLQEAALEAHFEFVKTRGKRQDYLDALKALGAQLAKRYEANETMSAHHVRQEDSDPLSKMKTFDYDAMLDLQDQNLEDFEALSLQDITLEKFDEMLGEDKSKAAAEKLFTRMAIWCLEGKDFRPGMCLNLGGVVFLGGIACDAYVPVSFSSQVLPALNYEAFLTAVFECDLFFPKAYNTETEARMRGLLAEIDARGSQ